MFYLYHFNTTYIHYPSERNVIVHTGMNKVVLYCTHMHGILCWIVLASNIGTEGTARQSSTELNRYARYAVDGNTDGVFSHNSCTKTTRSDYPWWTIEFQHTVLVIEIIITNRVDCCRKFYIHTILMYLRLSFLCRPLYGKPNLILHCSAVIVILINGRPSRWSSWYMNGMRQCERTSGVCGRTRLCVYC